MKILSCPLFIMSISFCVFSCIGENSEIINEEITTLKVEKKTSSWSTVFKDNFDTDSKIDTNWEITSGRTDYNSSICHYNASFTTLATHDGKQCLLLAAKKISTTEYRAGHVKSKISFVPDSGEEYRLRALIKLVAKKDSAYKAFGETYGAWPAFWTVQETNWPIRGEIDIMEGYSKSPEPPHFASNLFYGTSAGKNLLENAATHSYYVSEGWHTYEMRWKKSKNECITLYIYLDGTKIKTYDAYTHPNLNLQNFGPHNIILNLNVGSDTGIFDTTKINLFSTVQMFVDYVHLQKRIL